MMTWALLSSFKTNISKAITNRCEVIGIDIYGYNLLIKKEFRITDNTADQINPVISGSVVVWQDKRKGNWDIYGAKLSGAILATCTTPLAGDIDSNCKVNFSDFALFAAQWLGCNIEPKTSCL